MIEKQETEGKFRKLCEWNMDTKRLVEEKSQEFHISANKVTELCLQRYLPEMQMWS